MARQPTYSPAAFVTNTVIVGSARPTPPRFVIRRRHVFSVIGIVIALLALYVFGYEPAYQGTLVVGAPRPLIYANRGFGDYGPDNSLYAMDRALEAGMDGSNVHGQLTSDGELVVFRDKTVERLTSGSGAVSEKTVREMEALDLGPKYKAGFSGAYVRTFEDFVRSVKGRGTLIVELDASGLASIGIEQRAVEIIRKYDAHLSVVLSSPNPLVLYRVKQLDQFVRTAFVFTDSNRLDAEATQGDVPPQPWLLRQEFIRRGIRKLVRFDLLSIQHQVNAATIDRLIAKGWPAFMWTPDSEADIRGALAKRPYAIISNQPILARHLRGE
jgi:glycerophosphoryl diester phosphodiesterase